MEIAFSEGPGPMKGNPIRETPKMRNSVGKNKLCKLSTNGVTQQTNKLLGKVTPHVSTICQSLYLMFATAKRSTGFTICRRKSPECCIYEEGLRECPTGCHHSN
jgi:hypothetical protein